MEQHSKSYVDDDGKIVVGSTFLKAFMNETACPKQLQAVFIFNTHQNSTSEAMRLGLYFEQKVLGATSTSDAEIQARTKAGEKKKVDYERLDMQVNTFEQLLFIHDIKINHKQIGFYEDLSEHYKLGTVLDIVGTINDPEYGPETPCIIDVKVTKDINSTFGDFQWGMPELRDHTQAFLSAYSIKANTDVEHKFYYLVFGYGPDMGYKLIEKKITAIDFMELQESVRTVFERIKEFGQGEWATNPTWDNCKTCPLKHECNQSIKLQPISRC